MQLSVDSGASADGESFLAEKSVLTITGEREEVVVDLSFDPAAVIAWWTRQGHHGIGFENAGGIGLWTKQATRSVAWISEDAQPAARVRRVADTSALLGLGRGTEGVTMRAELESVGRARLTLRFTIAPREPWTVHLLALGGASVRARLGETDPPDTPRTELELDDLRPDLVLFVPGTGPVAPPALEVTIGAAAGSGQAVAGYSVKHGSPPGAVVAAQRGDAATILPPADGDSVRVGRLRARSRHDAYLEFQGAARDWPAALYLALEGVRASVGTDVSPRVPGLRRTKVGFRPEALLAFSLGLSPASRPRGIGRLCLGGATPKASGCAGWDDRNVKAERTSTHVLSSVEHLLVVADTRTGGVHAQAKLAAVDGRGFTLDWERSDGESREFVFVALGGRGPTPTEQTSVRSRLARAVRLA